MIATIADSGIWQTILHDGPHWLALALALLPTLINGLTDYPNLSTFLGKLQSLLGLLSVVVHRDSPGTFKLPLTHSEPPEVVGSSIGPVAIKGPANTGLVTRDTLFGLVAWSVLAGSLAVLLGSCAWLQKTKADVVECSKEAVQSLEHNALGDVTSILLAGVAGWQAELASIASKVGDEVVGCIVAKLASGWTPPPGTDAALPPAAVRAYQYLNAQPKTFKI